LETFKEVELTAEETAEALRKGREEKYYELQRIAYNEKIKARKLYPQFSADQLRSIYETYFELDEINSPVVNQICRYFANDPAFEGDLNKGLFLMGGVGVGKTTIMKMFIKNQRFSYRVDSCRDVEANYSAYGDDYLQTVSVNLPIAVNSDPFGHQEIGYCFDDLGTESDGKHYGKGKNVMADVVLNRYDNKLNYCSTHITTNLSAGEIKAQYGSRVTDRIREMFNIIKFPGDAKSRRK
jgi:DNA replication protein DnaC